MSKSTVTTLLWIAAALTGVGGLAFLAYTAFQTIQKNNLTYQMQEEQLTQQEELFQQKLQQQQQQAAQGGAGGLLNAALGFFGL